MESLIESKSSYLSGNLSLLLGHECLMPCRVAGGQELVGGQPRHDPLSAMDLAKGHSQKSALNLELCKVE